MIVDIQEYIEERGLSSNLDEIDSWVNFDMDSFDSDRPYYQSLYPDFYAPQPLKADQTKDKVIYLTFDDGPSDRTDEILEILDKQNVKATFFVIGKDDEKSRKRMKQIVDAGHTLGMHTYSHDYDAIYESVESYLDDMCHVFTIIREATGETPTCFRFPGGSINSHNYTIYQELMAEMLRRGFVPYDWNISAQDAVGGSITPDEITERVLRAGKRCNTGVVLMHDSQDKVSTTRALNRIINGLEEEGFTFEALTPEVKPILFTYKE